MGEYTGLVMFLWIVGAPTIGFVLLSFWEPRVTHARTATDAQRSPMR